MRREETKKMIPKIIYQDEELLVLDKPTGMVVNRAESVKGETVQEWVENTIKDQRLKINNERSMYGDHIIQSDFFNRAGIVHRIDKETSGILLVAKTLETFEELQRQFKERIVKKTYVALVHGILPEEGEIRAPVGRLPWNREHFGVVPGGKESVTKFKRITNYELRIIGKKESISLVEVYPETGRTHQIRVHFKYLGYPLVGDYLYGGRKQSRDDRLWAPRVMLHAWKISLLHVKTHTPLAFEAPIPDDMKRIVQSEYMVKHPNDPKKNSI